MTLTRRELFQAARAARVRIDRNELVGPWLRCRAR